MMDGEKLKPSEYAIAELIFNDKCEVCFYKEKE